MPRLLTAFLLLPLFAQAQPLVWAPGSEAMEIGRQVEVLEDPQGAFTFEQVSGPAMHGSFSRPGNTNLILGYTLSVFWARFTLNNPTDHPLMLEIAQAGLPDCDLYFRDDSGRVVLKKAGSNTVFHEREVKSSFQVFPLPPGQRDYYVRLTTNSGPIPLRIDAPQAYEDKANFQKFIYGIYLGLMLFVLLSNIFYFISLRETLYLVNALLVLIFTCYSMVVVDGFVVYFFPKVDMLFWYTAIPAFGVTVQTIYCLWFLEVKKYRPRLYQAVSVLIVVYALWFLLKNFLSFPIQQPINTLQALLSFIVMGYVGVKVGKSGNRFGYYFALTYFVYFLLVLAEAMYINTGKPEYILGLSYSGHATVFEALLLTFLLTKRFEWEKDEVEKKRREAQDELIEQIRENERIVRDQNIILEEKVKQRTTDLIRANDDLNVSLNTVEVERAKSDKLLLNILPSVIAEELKESGKTEPLTIKRASVLFTDFKEFTSKAQHFSAEELVEELNVCYEQFDNICAHYGVEKIKTIGDSYMAAGGLPLPSADSVENTVRAALRMAAFIVERKRERERQGKPYFEMRTGIHTGPVVAGVVGKHKFQYDIWGDTVNLASRMESSGEVGRVNISGHTKALLGDRFGCIPRGEVNVKGLGLVEMYWVQEAEAH